MARTRRIKKDGDGHYHLMSRTNDRRFLFEKGEIKSELVATLRRVAEFCGIRVKAYVAMSNHFHVIVKVTKPDVPLGANELLRRVGVLKGEKARAELAERWDDLAAAGFSALLKDEQDRLLRRMHDVSEFVKLFKEEFDRIYKRRRKYCGSIWSGRFASTLIEDGEYLKRCMRYVVYNPVRAGMVSQAKDYLWSWCENELENEVFAGAVPTECEGNREDTVSVAVMYGAGGRLRAAGGMCRGGAGMVTVSARCSSRVRTSGLRVRRIGLRSGEELTAISSGGRLVFDKEAAFVLLFIQTQCVDRGGGARRQ